MVGYMEALPSPNILHQMEATPHLLSGLLLSMSYPSLEFCM